MMLRQRTVPEDEISEFSEICEQTVNAKPEKTYQSSPERISKSSNQLSDTSNVAVNRLQYNHQLKDTPIHIMTECQQREYADVF